MTINMSDLEKLPEKFPEVDISKSYKDKPLKGINTYESTQIYLNTHKIQALWFLKNSDLIHQTLVSYYLGEKPRNE